MVVTDSLLYIGTCIRRVRSSLLLKSVIGAASSGDGRRRAPAKPKHIPFAFMKHSQKLRTKRPAILATGIATLFIALSSALSPAAVTYVGDAIINGTQIDQSGLPATVLADGASTQNALNGIGSGFAYAGGNLFSALCDRGPNKVTLQRRCGCGLHAELRLPHPAVHPEPYPGRLAGRLRPLCLLHRGREECGHNPAEEWQRAQYVGISSAYTNGTRLDPESVRVAPDGTFWITDEYGPFILHFNRLGQQIGSLTLPAGFQIANPDSVGTNEIANNTTGRVNNKGMEGVALTPDGKKLVALCNRAHSGRRHQWPQRADRGV